MGLQRPLKNQNLCLQAPNAEQSIREVCINPLHSLSKHIQSCSQHHPFVRGGCSDSDTVCSIVPHTTVPLQVTGLQIKLK